MQSDPIGYNDGMNFYNFAHGDPVNGSNPNGLDDDDPPPAIEGGYGDGPDDGEYIVAKGGCDNEGCTVVGHSGTSIPPSLTIQSYGSNNGPNLGGGNDRTDRNSPQNKANSSECTAAQQRLSNIGSQIEQFGNSLQLIGLGLGGSGLLASEGGGEALFPGAVGLHLLFAV